jgi:hypothetical protein
MTLLNKILPAGLVLGDGVRAYTVEKVTNENIYLRGHPDGQRSESKTGGGVLRIIPTQVIDDILAGIETGKIGLEDIIRKHRIENNLPTLFVGLGVEHDPYILGYDSSIYKICEYCLNNPIETGQRVDVGKTAKAFYQDVSDGTVGLQVSEKLATNAIASMLSKRFLVFTGLAGSGKTKIAHAFASWISESPEQYRLIAVGADWTSNENVLGYQDALQPTIYRKPVSGALDLILQAGTDVNRPYFLILDEMNLSHVERYFADILSAIESGQEIALHSATEPLGAVENDPLPVPAKLRLPENLFIIGTVNIDETTYMFSPKVLDRANVIEFRVSADEISSFLESPAKVDMDALAGNGAGYGSAFVNSAKAEVSLVQLPVGIGDGTAAAAELKQRLTELFIELAPIGAEFGFRTAFEVSRFFYHHAVLTGDGWQFKDALDAQIVQKLMPKLHGSDRKLRKVLDKLQTFCETHDLQLSLAKTKRMLERLTQDGFTSFAEA